MNDWSPPQRPAEYAEKSLILAILNNDYCPGSVLPAERELATKLGVTRPTLREALQRLGRDGWLTIQQGRATRVNDYWREGGLNVLNALVQYPEKLSTNFIPNLLEVRLVLAPAYARLAVINNPELVCNCLRGNNSLENTPEVYASFDWKLHHTLTIASGNPIYTLILNGFENLYEHMACIYFELEVTRKTSNEFYRLLDEAARRNDAIAAEQITRKVMEESLRLWVEYEGGSS